MTERARAVLDKLRNGEAISGDELNEVYAALPTPQSRTLSRATSYGVFKMTTGGDCGRCGKWFETQCYDDQGYGDCPECIEKLKAEQPTPQNREADMPDALWIENCNQVKEIGRLNAHITKLDAKIDALRADLANKPALDAEVREAIKDLNDDIYMLEIGADHISTPKKMAAQIKTLIRAASAVQEPQEVTVEELSVIIAEEISRNTKPVDYTEIGDAPAIAIQKYYPNGLKLVKERKE